ncbi:pre-toxin TG domain-containing protein [Listeria booriae]|uniref:pre-toxin TG domain-containing protein n=1 Tax=Listeria booriae TaxID=1552123 RepID=UPI0021AB4524|nr:pre-toxin TG domain-containing protein [Listeria booriae]
MDVKYSNNSWDKSKNALKTLIGLGWGKGVTDYLKDINRNFEDAQNDIRKDDRDGVISFSFTDKESKYQQLFEKIEVLHDYASDAGSMVERVIDEPFYKDIDKFAEKMRDLSIDDYETKNTIGATTIVSTGAYGYGYGQTTTEVPKDSIKLSDIMAGDNFFATNLKAQFAEYSKQNPDQEFTYEQYQSAVSSSRAFEYESIRDGQQNIEFWRDIGIAVVIIATSIVCPPAGLALGIAYGTLELSSAATGKDWLTGREMDAGERATRGAFALLDIIPGVKGLHAFSTATKAGGVALDAVQAGSKLTLKQTAKQGLSNLDAMGKQALRESAERIRNVPKVLKDTANTVKNTAQEGLTATKNMATNFGDNVRNLNFGQPRLVADGFGDVGNNVIRNSDGVSTNINKIISNGMDDVGKNLDEVTTGPRYGERRISDELYDELRECTPTPELRNKVNEGVELPMSDPAIPGKEIVKRLEADHIVPMDKITKMEGFEQLTKEEQLSILNYEENFTGLSRSANASKGSKSFEEWTIYKKEGIPIDPVFREKMIGLEKDLGIKLQQMIDDILKGR